MFIFPVWLTTSRVSNLTGLIHTLLHVITIHIHIYIYIHDFLCGGGKEKEEKIYVYVEATMPSMNLNHQKHRFLVFWLNGSRTLCVLLLLIVYIKCPITVGGIKNRFRLMLLFLHKSITYPLQYLSRYEGK